MTFVEWLFLTVMFTKRLLCLLSLVLVLGCEAETRRSVAAKPPRPASKVLEVSQPPSSPPRVALPAPTRQVRLLLMGDSLARGTGDETGRGFGGILSEELERRGTSTTELTNVATDGARTYHLLRQLGTERVRAQVERSDVIVISIGANDLFIDAGPRRTDLPSDPQLITERVLLRLDQVISGLRELNPQARIFLLGLYNPFFESSFGPVAATFLQQWNGSLRTRYRDAGVEVIETLDILNTPERLSIDQFHPSSEGYRRIAARIAREI